jgi:hypothetical protein
MRVYFSIVGGVDLDALGEFASVHFATPRARVCVYDNAWDIQPPFEASPAGPLWGAYEHSQICVQVGHSETGAGPVGGWFHFEKTDPQKPFDMRTVAHAAAAFLNASILYPDPPPGDQSQYADAAQIEVTPRGVERKVWFSEYGEDGRSKNAIEERA